MKKIKNWSNIVLFIEFIMSIYLLKARYADEKKIDVPNIDWE